MLKHISLSLVIVLGSAAAAAAQQPQAPPPSSGPLVLEPLNNGFVIAPEVKFTKFGGSTGTLAGAYGGWVKDDHLFIGGAGYGLTDRKRGGRNLGYGGVVIGWFFNPDQPLSASVKTLVGFGEVTQPVTQTIQVPDFDGWTPRSGAVPTLVPVTQTYRLRQDFIVAEPEVDLLAKIGRHARVSFGAGYRATAQQRYGYDLRAGGAVGTVSVQFEF